MAKVKGREGINAYSRTWIN